MKKYGLRLGTLKGELFRMLNEQGGKNGLKISELANAAVEVVFSEIIISFLLVNPKIIISNRIGCWLML